MGDYMEQFVAKLRGFEGSVPWMYLDTVGKITVGVGLMLPNEAAARALPFAIGDRPATPDEIAAEFARVGKLKGGRMASFYKPKSGLQLSEEAIRERLEATVKGIEGYLRSHVPQYDTLPDGAKMGLLDMVYNLGPGRFFSQYSKLLAAIGRGDWKAAAAASSRKGPSTERNAWTRDQFLDAAKAAVAKIEAEVAKTGLGGFLTGLGLVGGVAALLLLLEDRLDRR